MESQYFRISLTDEAKRALRRIRKKFGKNTYEVLRDRIQGLEFNPDQRGEPLRGQLRGLYSLHYSRFRILYRIDNDEATVFVIGGGVHENGSRKDVYKVVERWIEKRGRFEE